MPLKSGSSPDVISQNISELMKSYKRSGRIGKTKPRDAAHAMRIASAIAKDKSRGGK